VKQFGVGVVGLGLRGLGTGMVDYMHNPDEGLFLVGVSDIKPEILAMFKNKPFAGDTFTSTQYQDLLDCPEISAIFIMTPDFLHEEQAVAALEAGKHVFLEKPMAITTQGCDRILETARRVDKKVYVGHNMRHMELILAMKSIIDSGSIGRIVTIWCRHFVSYGGDAYFKDWHAQRKYVNGLLLQKAAHDIDVMHWLGGGYTRFVHAMDRNPTYGRALDPSKREDYLKAESRVTIRQFSVPENWPPLGQENLNPDMDVEDVSLVNMVFDNGVFASYQQCHFTPDAWRNYTFIGTEGRIENIGSSQIRILKNRVDGYSEGEILRVLPPAGGHGGADPRIVEEFIGYVRDGKKITVSPIAARQAVATGDLATQSLRGDMGCREVPQLPADLIDYFEKDLV